MIWVLDKYIKTIRGIPIPSGPYEGLMMGPTFENVTLGPRKDSFAGLTAYGNAAISAADAIAATDPTLSDTMSSVVWYIDVALNATSGDHPMHLPDVGPYWAAVQ
jgi:hypothetical protein